MRCPNCEYHIGIEDWQDNEPFDCEHCETILKLNIDESTYTGATETRLIIWDEKE